MVEEVKEDEEVVVVAAAAAAAAAIRVGWVSSSKRIRMEAASQRRARLGSVSSEFLDCSVLCWALFRGYEDTA